MSRQFDNLKKAIDEYLETKEGFGLFHLVTNSQKDMNGEVIMGFSDDAPFYIDTNGAIHIKDLAEFKGDLDRLNAITRHHEELTNIMANQAHVYYILVAILSVYDKVLGVNSFKDQVKQRVH